MKHWNLKRVLSLLLVVCMVTGLLSGVSAMAEDQTANYHEISTDGLKLATEDNTAADETERPLEPDAGRQRHVRRPALWQDGRGRSAEGR